MTPPPMRKRNSDDRPVNRPWAKDLEVAKDSIFLQAISSHGWMLYMQGRQRRLEVRLFQEILNACKGNVSQAARLMHMDRANVRRLIRKLRMPT